MELEKNRKSEPARPAADRERMSATDESHLLDYLLVLLRHWKMIAKATVATALLACGLVLLLPNVFVATARLLPPQPEGGGTAALLSGMGDLAALAGVSLGAAPGDLYVGMLRSRSVADALIDRFNLMELYDEEYRVKTYQALADHVEISLGKDDGIIAIAVEDEDPQRAAEMANAFVEELKKINVRLNLSSAGRERVFLEERLAAAREDLALAEEKLRDFQEQNKAIRIEAQASAIIEAIAELKGQLASREVELGILLAYQTEQNPQVRSVREAITQLKAQLRKLEHSPEGRKVADDIFIATSDVPALGVQLGRLLRDFKVQETLFELLTRQYEVAKITEAKNTSAIQVLDQAVAPDRKSKPKRAIIVLLVTFAAGFLAVLAAFIRDYLQRMPPADRARWEEVRMLVPWRRKTAGAADAG